MTTAEKDKLGCDIATAEGLTVSSNGQYVVGREDEDGDIWYVSNYLTDPAEKWRMLEALVETYSGVTLHRYKDEKTFCSIDNGLWHTTGETTTHAVAEAYLAMLDV